jgi:DNA repair protein RadC
MLQDEAQRLMTRVYEKDITLIADGKTKFDAEHGRLLKNLTSRSLKLHPYVVLLGRKPLKLKRNMDFKSNKKTPEAADAGEKYRDKATQKNSGYKIRFRDLPDELKPREKLIMSGSSALKNHELLAILLVTGTTKENVIELSKRLIQEYGSRAIAQERSVRRLMETLGIGPKKACQIAAAFELGRRFFEEPRSKAPTILAADDAYEYLKEMAKYTREHFRGLYLNTRGRIIRDEIISIGTLNMSVVHPREVFLPAVEFSAAAIILAHNHPSGDPTPSDEDLAITQQIVEAGRVMSIEVFDHIIIGENRYISLQREGLLR